MTLADNENSRRADLFPRHIFHATKKPPGLEEKGPFEETLHPSTHRTRDYLRIVFGPRDYSVGTRRQSGGKSLPRVDIRYRMPGNTPDNTWTPARTKLILPPTRPSQQLRLSQRLGHYPSYRPYGPEPSRSTDRHRQHWNCY